MLDIIVFRIHKIACELQINHEQNNQKLPKCIKLLQNDVHFVTESLNPIRFNAIW